MSSTLFFAPLFFDCNSVCYERVWCAVEKEQRCEEVKGRSSERVWLSQTERGEENGERGEGEVGEGGGGRVSCRKGELMVGWHSHSRDVTWTHFSTPSSLSFSLPSPLLPSPSFSSPLLSPSPLFPTLPHSPTHTLPHSPTPPTLTHTHPPPSTLAKQWRRLCRNGLGMHTTGKSR